MLVAGPLVELDAVMELTPKLDDVPIVEAGDETGEVPEVEDGMEMVPEPNREEDSMQTSTPVFDMSVGNMVVEDTHVHGTDMSVDSMVAEDTHVQGTDMSVDSMVAEDTHVHGTDMSVDSMMSEDTHVHETGATLNNFDHTHMDMMVEDCIQTPIGETSVASPLFSFDSSTQPPFSSYALHLDWWPVWSAKSNW
nr:hypothetical protein [Tanacetum cinerariifolium]